MAMRNSCTWHRCGESVVVSRFSSEENIRSPEQLHYTLGKTIGSGTYAKVKAAWCPYERKMIAIKIMEKRGTKEHFLKKFLPREMQALQQLRHPNLLRVYRLVETPDQAYFMLEMAENGDLLDYMNTVHHVPEPEARFIMRSISAGIAHCHSKNIIHRDLKCENILVTKDMTIKIGDFGFCRHIDDCSSSMTPCGSFSYAAPELFSGPPEPAVSYDGKKADVWSMGCILYTLVCGRLPFGDDCEVARNVCKPLKFPMLLSEECKQLLGFGMLNLDVETRCTVEQVRISHWMRGPVSPLTQYRPTLYTTEECLPEVLLDPFFAEDAHYITDSSPSSAATIPVSVEQPPKLSQASQPSSPEDSLEMVPAKECGSPTFQFRGLLNPTNPFDGLSLASTPLNPSSQANLDLPSNPFELSPQATPGPLKKKDIHRRRRAAVTHLPQRISNTAVFPSSMPTFQANPFEPPVDYLSPGDTCSSDTSTSFETSTSNTPTTTLEAAIPFDVPYEPSTSSSGSSVSTSQVSPPTESSSPFSSAAASPVPSPASPDTPKTKEVHRRKKTAVALLHQRKRILDDPSSVLITTPVVPLTVKPTSIRQKISSAGKKLVQSISKYSSSHQPATE